MSRGIEFGRKVRSRGTSGDSSPDGTAVQRMSRGQLAVVAWGAFLFYSAVVAGTYVWVISPRWTSIGLYAGDVQFFPNFIVWLLLAGAPLPFLPRGPRMPSDIAAWYVAIFFHIPAAVVIPFQRAADGGEAFDQVAIVALSGVVVAGFGIISRFPTPRVAAPGVGTRGAWAIVLVATVGLTGAVLIVYMGSMELVGLTEVRSQRFEARELSGTPTGTVGAYAVNWIGFAIVPMLIAFGLCYRRYALVFAALFLALIGYSVAGARSILGGVLLVVGCYFWLRHSSGEAHTRLPVAFGVIVLLLVLAGSVTESIVADWLIYRNWYTPASNLEVYVDFFETYPTTGLHSQIPFIGGSSPYDESVARMLGRVVVGDPGVSKNAGYLAGGFASGRYLGAVIASVLAALVLWVGNVAVGEGRRWALPAFAAQGIALVNVPVSVFAATGGFLALCVLVWVVGDTESQGRSPRSAPPV